MKFMNSDVSEKEMPEKDITNAGRKMINSRKHSDQISDSFTRSLYMKPHGKLKFCICFLLLFLFCCKILGLSTRTKFFQKLSK